MKKCAEQEEGNAEKEETREMEDEEKKENLLTGRKCFLRTQANLGLSLVRMIRSHNRIGRM